MSPFTEGKMAFHAGTPRYNNPYHYDDEEFLKHAAWARGWAYAYGGGK